MAQTRNPAAALLVVIFLIWLFLPDGGFQGQSLVLSDVVAARLARYHQGLEVLKTTSWGDFAPPRSHDEQEQGQDEDQEAKYIKLTGFRAQDGFAWQDLDDFRQRGLRLSRYAIAPVDGRQLWDVAQGEAVWTNASGTLRGEWVRRQGSVQRSFDSYNLSRSVPEMDWVGHGVEWARNMTGATGRMMLRLEGNSSVMLYGDEEQADASQDLPLSGGVIRNVKATVTVEDTAGSGLNWEMRLWGVHWPRQGVVLLTTTSEKFEGILGLPHLTPSGSFFRSSQRLLEQMVARVLDGKSSSANMDQNMPWNSDVDNAQYTAYASPHCEFVMYAQVHPPAGLHKKQASQEVIGAIEAELQNPLGAPIRSVPRLVMSAVVWSPDCAFFLETKGPPDFAPGPADHLVGMKTEVHTHHVKMWMLVYALLVLGQVRLLKDQVKESLTPSTLGRISFWTISAMVMVDGMTFTAAATWVSSAAATFLPTLALMFASFLSMTIGGSFLHKMHEMQQPVARLAREQTSRGSNSASGDDTPTATGAILPGPVTANRSSQQPPVIVPSDQDVAAEMAQAASAVPRPGAGSATSTPQALSFQAIVGRFILASLCLCFLAISSSTWYPRPRSLLLNFCAAAYLSLWIPQIYRNAVRNCRRALAWPFVIGQSVLRLLPIAYFWLNEDNFLYARPDRLAFVLFVAWVWIQILVLAAQDVLGPRFGLPASWCPEAWDYHPVLREDGLEAGGLPIGLVAAPSDDHHVDALDKHASPASHAKPPAGCSLRTIDCAICREALQVPVVRAGHDDSAATGVASVFARRLYMVTPCRHVFHTTCLEGWIKFRLQCPICRDDLPPI
ncbi:hypothetical protein CDD81_3604 [Ophiocordyceps australis]|uniref:DSC E3 ubiquitin ligase complex subunit A n=1 Tax=Ophiocordyceps australis TaxID=1399860 RepID=A0A2C5Y8C8_9HYPO|nr:hypothetical protein CDD81_3604 [Ophiocordyceps australis]